METSNSSNSSNNNHLHPSHSHKTAIATAGGISGISAGSSVKPPTKLVTTASGATYEILMDRRLSADSGGNDTGSVTMASGNQSN